MSLLESFSAYKNKLLIAVILTVFTGAALLKIKAMDIVSGEYLTLELSFLVTNYLLLLLVGLVTITSILAILPAIKGSSNYMNGFKVALILAITVGFVFGILKSLAFVVANKYMELGMYYSIIHSASSIINRSLSVAIVVAVFVLIVFLVIKALLNFVRLDGRIGYIILSGVLPSLLIFIAGGYWLNKSYFPKFFELKSIIGNALWGVTSLLLLFAIGWMILKFSELRVSLASATYSSKVLVVVLSLLLIFNLTNYLYLRAINKERPNLILISIDTLRADHLGSYGYDRDTSANIDGFAKDGVRFANTIAQASWTLPSHMSLLTGLYVSTHGVTWPISKLSNMHLTLAEVLQSVGYETVAFTDGGYVSHKFGYQGFDRFEEGYYKELGGVETWYKKAINWLQKEHERPFFLFLHTYQVHCPYDPPSDYDIYSDKTYRGIVQIAGNCSKYYETIKPKMKYEDYHYVIDKYDGLIHHTDHFMGKLFDELKSLGLYENSVIVFTSDHGENFLDHLDYNINHVELYDEIIKVPLIIKAPGFPKNAVVHEQVESIDVMPTVLELLKIPTPRKLDGKSLVELVKKGSYDRIFTFSENWWHSPHKIHKVIRSKDWKLLRRSETDVELFDLKNDPHEQRNLLTDEPQIVRSLYESLQTWMDAQEEKSKLYSTDKVQIDDKLTEQLKALGYVN